MVLLFEFSPKLADLRRIKVFTFENGRFPLFRSECLWNTLRGEKWSKNGTNDLYWTYNEGLWWNWAQKIFEISKCLIIQIQSHLQGVPKKMWFKLIFEFLTMGRVFLGVKNDFNNFGNKKIIRLLSKILSKLTLFIRKMQKFWCFYELIAMSRMEKRI